MSTSIDTLRAELVALLDDLRNTHQMANDLREVVRRAGGSGGDVPLEGVLEQHRETIAGAVDHWTAQTNRGRRPTCRGTPRRRRRCTSCWCGSPP